MTNLGDQYQLQLFYKKKYVIKLKSRQFMEYELTTNAF